MEVPPAQAPKRAAPLPPPVLNESSSRSFSLWLVAAFIAVNLLLIGLIVFWVKDRPQATESVRYSTSLPVAEPAQELPADIIQQLNDLVPVVAAISPLLAEERPMVEPVLRIAKLELCRSVSGFGSYERIPAEGLLPRHLAHIQAYVEILNPKAQRHEDGRYNYFLTKSMKLYHNRIGPSEPLMDTAVSLAMGGFSPRHDFHATHPLQASGRIFPGDYTLVVRITDQISGEIAVAETGFTIVAPAAP
jgi:hypothetical protein